MNKGNTPTITLTLPDEINLDYANHVYVTFQDREKKVTKTGSDITVDENTVEVFLTQEETLAFNTGAVYVQLNWTYQEGDVTKRASSDIVGLIFKRNLEGGVLA